MDDKLRAAFDSVHAEEALKEAKEIAFHDLGCESVKRFTIENLPIFTAIDCQGTSIFAEGRKEFALL